MTYKQVRKYHWLKLDRNFFKRHDIRIVEEMPNGKEYVLFYMKLLLESIDHEGSLRFNDLIPYNDHMLATVTNTNIDIVRNAIKILTQLKLLTLLDDETIYIHDTQKMLGESSSKHRVRKYRERQKLLEKSDGVTSGNVTEALHVTELEKEIELELDINKTIPFSEVISYLNQKAGTKYRNVESHKKYIRARWNEGYRLEDFKKVIDKKVEEWSSTEFETYLRPSTLFGTKFDNYLNQSAKKHGRYDAPIPDYDDQVNMSESEEKALREKINKMLEEK